MSDETGTTPEPEPTPEPAPETPSVPSPEVVATADRGTWECLNEARFCSLAAPDARTPGKPFEGPTQVIARTAGGAGAVHCPECGSSHVIYRGDKVNAAVAA